MEQREDQVEFTIKKVEKTTDKKIEKTKNYFSKIGNFLLGSTFLASSYGILKMVDDSPMNYLTLLAEIGGITNAIGAQKCFFNFLQQFSFPSMVKDKKDCKEYTIQYRVEKGNQK